MAIRSSGKVYISAINGPATGAGLGITTACDFRIAARSARFGALAVLEPETGTPLASRVGVATDLDGTPLILISMLSAHTGALLADPRCSLLVGEPGKGDALAHPRITLVCRAARLERGTPEHARAERRYLNRNPKAKLYVGLGDFSFFRLEVERASLNGGFGKAYLLDRADLLAGGPVAEELATSEQPAIDHMNTDHLDAIALYALHFVWQVRRLRPDDPKLSLRLFKSNRDAGLILLAAIAFNGLAF